MAKPAADGAKEQAVIEMWNRRMELNLMASITTVFRHLHPAMADLEVPQVPEWAEANKPKVEFHEARSSHGCL